MKRSSQEKSAQRRATRMKNAKTVIVRGADRDRRIVARGQIIAAETENDLENGGTDAVIATEIEEKVAIVTTSVAVVIVGVTGTTGVETGEMVTVDRMEIEEIAEEKKTLEGLTERRTAIDETKEAAAVGIATKIVAIVAAETVVGIEMTTNAGIVPAIAKIKMISPESVPPKKMEKKPTLRKQQRRILHRHLGLLSLKRIPHRHHELQKRTRQRHLRRTQRLRRQKRNHRCRQNRLRKRKKLTTRQQQAPCLTCWGATKSQYRRLLLILRLRLTQQSQQLPIPSDLRQPPRNHRQPQKPLKR